MIFDPLNYSQINTLATGVPQLIINPFDYVIIFLLSVIAFTELLRTLNILRSWITDKGE